MGKAEDTLGGTCVEIAAKLEFQARNTPNHHTLLFLEGRVLEDVDEIDSLIFAELPSEEEDSELRGLAKHFNIHRYNRYGIGRTRNWK